MPLRPADLTRLLIKFGKPLNLLGLEKLFQTFHGSFYLLGQFIVYRIPQYILLKIATS